MALYNVPMLEAWVRAAVPRKVAYLAYARTGGFKAEPGTFSASSRYQCFPSADGQVDSADRRCSKGVRRGESLVLLIADNTDEF